MLNGSHFKLYLKKGLSQNLLILLVAALIGFSVNWLRSDGISIVGDWSSEGRVTDDTGVSLVIPLSEAKMLYEKNRALFLDARSKEFFDTGHIKGAKNLPWHEVDDYFIEIVNDLDRNTRIITYCDGENCDLSHELALFLKQMGFQNTQVLVNGWTVWQESNLSVEGEAFE